MPNPSNQISQLQQHVEGLKQSCDQFDKRKLFKSERFLNKQFGLFEHHLFRTKSTKLSDYLNETIDKLNHLPSPERRHAHRFALESISAQVNAIITTLKATSVWQKELSLKPKYKFKKAVQTIVQSSQELYAELSQNHEFERRLLTMIEVRQDEKVNADNTRAAKLNEEILVLHGRLGRCRKAITAVEEKIQKVEKSNR
jgi:primosomal replication protein N''